MEVKNRLVAILLLTGLLIGGLAGGIALVGQLDSAAAAPFVQTSDSCLKDDDDMEEPTTDDLDNVEEEVECDSQDNDEVDVGDEEDESQEVGELAPTGLGITAEDARAIAKEAYPNATVLEIEFEREGGVDLIEVELDNGAEIKIDAYTGKIFGTEARE